VNLSGGMHLVLTGDEDEAMKDADFCLTDVGMVYMMQNFSEKEEMATLS